MESLRTPNSVTNIFNNANTGTRNGNAHHHFASHQLSLNGRQLQAITVASASAFTGHSEILEPNTVSQTIEDPVQRPMSLPNYGELNQLQQQLALQPMQHYNLIDVDPSLIPNEQQPHNLRQQPWS